MRRQLAMLFFLLVAFCGQAGGQEGAGGAPPPAQETPQPACMPGMHMPGCPEDSPTSKTGLMNMQPETFVQKITSHAGSGTSVEAVSTPAPMLMKMSGRWMLMFHGSAFLLDQQQSGPRGGDKFFSINWLMPMAQRELGRGVFTVRTMLSIEPATVTQRRYPLLFQEGETAFGRPITDGQHPHDLFMEIAALYDLKIGERGLLSFYAAPIGDPALGPTAFPHRSSATENPVAALGHHQEDSTHVAADVVTVGVAYDRVRVEASGFHGREPNENRWNIDQGAIDSWSTRITVASGKNWSGQFSYGRIASPEAQSPGDDQDRMTASVMYNKLFTGGNWAGTIVWGRTKSRPDGAIFNSYLLESTIRFRTRNYVWTRIENAERSSELIFGNGPLPASFQEAPIGRVQAYTFGYDRDFKLVPHLATAIGAQASVYGVPSSLRAAYGTRPAGVAIFVRLRPE
jgi:hypothetical protein